MSTYTTRTFWAGVLSKESKCIIALQKGTI